MLSAAITNAVLDGDVRGVSNALAAGDSINDRAVGWAAGQFNNDVNYGWTLLWLALEHKCHDTFGMMDYLLEHGADPNAQIGRRRITILHCAASSGMPSIARLLLTYGAEVDVEDVDGITPLMRASHKTARVFLQHGADWTLRTHSDCDGGWNALEIANRRSMTHRERGGDPGVLSHHQKKYVLLSAVHAAGSWKRYVREPLVMMLSLRHLTQTGRATPPPHLERLFGAPRVNGWTLLGSRTLPDEVFKLVLSFWYRNERDWNDDDDDDDDDERSAGSDFLDDAAHRDLNDSEEYDELFADGDSDDDLW